MSSKGAIPLLTNQIIRYKSIKDIIYTTYNSKGIRGFYIGIIPSLIVGGFGEMIDNILWRTIKRRIYVQTKWEHYVLKMIIGSINTLMLFPMEKIGIEIITDKVRSVGIYKGYKDIIKKMSNGNKIKGLYSGIMLVLVSDVLSGGIYFMLNKLIYNNIKRKKRI
jgi:hypothetical protein